MTAKIDEDRESVLSNWLIRDYQHRIRAFTVMGRKAGHPEIEISTDRVVPHKQLQVFDGHQLWLLEYRGIRRRVSD